MIFLTDALIYPQSSTIFIGNGSVEVDLGYAIYKGVANASTGLNTFKGWVYALQYESMNMSLD